MSQGNVEVVRRGYRDFNERGVSALRRYLLDEVVWETPPNVPESGIHRGVDAVMAYVEGLTQAFEEVRLEPAEISVAGENEVFVVLRVHALDHDETPVHLKWWHLWTLQGGKASAVRSFLRQDEALEAAGLRE